jgi:hypothetical protein
MTFEQPRWVVGGVYRNIPLPPLPLLPLNLVNVPKVKVPKIKKYISDNGRCQGVIMENPCLEAQVQQHKQ